MARCCATTSAGDSDVDFVEEFEADASVSLLALCRWIWSSALVRNGDQRTAEDLSRYLRTYLLNGATVLYAS
jgi:hypothetical protein